MLDVLLTGDCGYIGTELKSYSEYISFIGCDIKNGKDVRCLSKGHFKKVDAIVHLAAIPGIANCEKDRINAFSTNVTGTLECVKIANELNIPLVFTSTQAAKNPDANFYAYTKRIAEEVINKTCKSRFVILRLTNVFGGLSYLLKKDTVVKRFITNDILTIDGDGNQKRNFVYVYDVGTAICNTIKHLINNRSCNGMIIDVHGGLENTLSVNNLCGLFPDKERVYDNTKSGGESSISIDYYSAESFINYKPQRSLVDYIKESRK